MTHTTHATTLQRAALLSASLALSALAGCAAVASLQKSAPKAAPTPAAAAPATSTQAKAPVTAAAPAAAALTWATFGPATATTAQGGFINTFSYSEKPGDVAMDALAITGDLLQVSGNFVAKGASAWAGLGVSVEAGNNQPMDASGYKTLRIRLAAPNGAKLRLRLNGTDVKVRDSGCFPSFTQVVTAKDTVYEIPFSRFAPEAYCGANGATVAKTLPRFAMVEVADTSDPVKTRRVQFSIGAITLLP
jgi:hypothetical protein